MPAYQPLITTDYFKGELAIGQLEMAAKRQSLESFIRSIEPKMLTQLMGKTLFNAFYAGITAATPAEKWKKLAYGQYFRIERSECWNGLINMNVSYTGLMSNTLTENDVDYNNWRASENSLIANYVYYYWLRKEATQPGGTGESVQGSHNGVTVTAAGKMAKAYNNAVEQMNLFYAFVDTFKSDYPEFDLRCEDRLCLEKINYPFGWM